MGRSKHAMWEHFEHCVTDKFKMARAKCKYCNESVSATPTNMSIHYENCKTVPHTVGCLLVKISKTPLLKPPTEISKTSIASPRRFGPLTKLITNTITTEMTKNIDIKFAKAMHGTASAFSFFEHPLWQDFLTLLLLAGNCCHLHVCRDRFWKTYRETTNQKIYFMKEGGRTLRIDRVTDNLAKSKSNDILILHIHCLLSILRRIWKERQPQMLSGRMKILKNGSTVKSG